ncbi:hypothetical protein D9613_011982 [Agrocybe pediades]|uniref:Uncharacterized protein n=1 Tax=Agrocybe pediades TaxID=84607 RepID=A0A8H4QFE8_9AGAR|nr:hypothetical protein D9613_011982 [Agrocybe pediades]
MAKIALYAKEKLGDSLDALLAGKLTGLVLQFAWFTTWIWNDDYVPAIKMYLEKLKDVGPIGDELMAAGLTTCCGWDVIDVLNAGLEAT